MDSHERDLMLKEEHEMEMTKAEEAVISEIENMDEYNNLLSIILVRLEEEVDLHQLHQFLDTNDAEQLLIDFLVRKNSKNDKV